MTRRLLLLAVALCAACATTAQTAQSENSANEPGTIVRRARPEVSKSMLPEGTPDPQESREIARSILEEWCDPPEQPHATPDQFVYVAEYDDALGKVVDRNVPLSAFAPAAQFQCRGRRWVRLAYVFDSTHYDDNGEGDGIIWDPVRSLNEAESARFVERRRRAEVAWEKWCRSGHLCPGEDRKLKIPGSNAEGAGRR